MAYGLFHFEVHVACGLFCYRIWYFYYQICESWLRRAQKVCNRERIIHGQSRLTFKAYHSRMLEDLIYRRGCRYLFQDRVFTSEAARSRVRAIYGGLQGCRTRSSCSASCLRSTAAPEACRAGPSHIWGSTSEPAFVQPLRPCLPRIRPRGAKF